MNQLPFIPVPYAHRSFDALQMNNISTHASGKNWLADHYMDIYIHNEYEKLGWDGFIDSDKLFQCPFVIYNCISKTNLFAINSDVISCLIHLLDQQNYILCSANKYYIPSFNEFNNQRIPHHIIISGYDLDAKCFQISDFISGKFQHVLCDFESLSRALIHCNLAEFDRQDANIPNAILHHYFDSVVLLKVDHNITYEFNKQLLIDSLERYITGERPSGMDYIPYAYEMYKLNFGINVLKTYIEKMKEFTTCATRPLYLMKMHKEIMRDRLIYLSENGHLKHSIYECVVGNNELIELYNQIMLLSMKYNMTCVTQEKLLHLEERINTAINKDLCNSRLILTSLKS